MSQDMKKLCNVEHVVLDMNGRIVEYRSNVYGYNKLFTFILRSGSCIIDLCSLECNEFEHKL